MHERADVQHRFQLAVHVMLVRELREQLGRCDDVHVVPGGHRLRGRGRLFVADDGAVRELRVGSLSARWGG